MILQKKNETQLKNIFKFQIKKLIFKIIFKKQFEKEK